MQYQFEPQLGGLVLDDEQHFVVVFRIADRVLRAEQGWQLQVGGVAHPRAEITDNAFVQLPGVLLNGHGAAFRCGTVPADGQRLASRSWAWTTSSRIWSTSASGPR
jgi:hypothetical protein